MGARLVRDRIDQVPGLHEDLRAHLRPVHDALELETLLRMKLLEEVAEFLAAQTPDEMAEEAADILQVLDAFQDRCGLPRGAFAIRQAKKYIQRGGFIHGLVLEL